MSLKTDYKNDSWEGKKRYLLTENEDGTVSIDDVTNYKVIGDIFNSDDINSTNTQVNANIQDIVSVDRKVEDIKTVRYAEFLSSGWSSSAPYAQTVSVPGIESSDTPIVSLYIPSTTPIGSVKGISKAYGCVDRAVTGNGNITLYCYNSKPATNFQIMIKGE